MPRKRFTFVLMTLVLGACAGADVEVTQKRQSDERLPYPQRILVYDFAVAPGEVDQGLAAEKKLETAVANTPEDQEKLQTARAVADIVAGELVEAIRELGLPAERWSGPVPAMDNGYSLEGQFVTIDEGNRALRMIIGFGFGGSEVQTLVQAYHIRGTGKELLGEAKVTAESSKKPGIAGTLPVGAAISGIRTAAAVSTGVGVVTEISQDVRDGAENTAEAIIDLLRPKFVEQGWIED